MRKKLKSITSLGLASVMFLSGCSAQYDYDSIPQQPALTKQEVIDYYAKEMSYDTIVNRAVKKTNTINWNGVPSNIADKLVDKTLEVIETHQLNAGYSGDMTPDVHDWLKLTLDDLVLVKPDGNFQYKDAESKGFYFVTVAFDTKLNSAGTMKNEANYLGINGVIIQDQDENPIIDESFLTSALKTMNARREAQGLKPYDSFGIDLNYVRETEATVEETLPETDAEGNVVTGRDDETETSATTEETSVQETETEPETLADINNNNNEYVPETSATDENNTPYRNLYANNVEDRQLQYDVVEFNRVVGTSKEQMAAVPYLGMIYNPVNTNGEISGYGIYQEGNYGLKDFGYDRANYTNGKMEITFVFKQDPNNRDDFNYSYCYINSYDSGIPQMGNLIRYDVTEEEVMKNKDEDPEINPDGSNIIIAKETIKDGDDNIITYQKDEGGWFYKEAEDIVISNYINEELDKVIERADRAINNKDTSALMSQDIFEGSDVGLKYAVWRNSTNLLTFMTKRVKTLARKEEDSRIYLVELERTTEESPKGFGNTGKYKDKYYAVIRQQGTNFRINDMVWVSRELERIPEPDADNSIIRRLTSLNLSGEVGEDTKEEISDMFGTFYYAIDNGVTVDTIKNGQIVVDPKSKFVRYGFYSRFDTDEALLNTDKREYLQSQIVARKLKNGNDYPASMTARITDWLGGYNDQVELLTEELYGYDKLNRGLYIQNYYLISHYGTEWVIDDIVPIEERDVEGEEFNEIKTRISQDGELVGQTKTRLASQIDSSNTTDDSNKTEESTESK